MGGSFQPCLLVLKASKAPFSLLALGGSLYSKEKDRKQYKSTTCNTACV